MLSKRILEEKHISDFIMYMKNDEKSINTIEKYIKVRFFCQDSHY